ncbi:hypothetical protein OAO87_04015 [bacterium]|nr:hypothetical protein [bacterium]
MASTVSNAFELPPRNAGGRHSTPQNAAAEPPTTRALSDPGAGAVEHNTPASRARAGAAHPDEATRNAFSRTRQASERRDDRAEAEHVTWLPAAKITEFPRWRAAAPAFAVA